MIPSNFLPIITIGFLVLGGRLSFGADGDVTIVSAPAATASVAGQTGSTTGDTTVVHKSSHKKKPVTPPDTASTDAVASALAITSPDDSPTPANVTPVPESSKLSTTAKPGQPASLTVASSTMTSSSSTPSVEIGLPVPRHTAANPNDLPSTPAVYQNLPASYQKIVSLSPPVSPNTTSRALSSYSSTASSGNSSAYFSFTDFDSRRFRNIYPWKTGIITTEFWIGEGGSSVSSTDNIASAWDVDWRQNYHGTDTPDDRRGYAPAGHAATLNTFYVALPFNDLVYPDKARRWLPPGWHRPPDKDGKPVSACKDRWVQIKNAQGRSCYAQWEDVGPLEYDNAEYVFGNDRPTTRYSGAGLDVSPAVADYLGIDGKNRITSWRFVDEEDVPPGYWLVYDEQALLYKAMHQSGSTPSQPIQRSSLPNDDPSNIDASQQKTGAAKG